MDISTTSLLANQLQTLDPKATAKENATKIIQESADIPLSLTAQKTVTTPNNAQEVIGQLLGSAVSEAKSKSAIFEILQHNQLFKNMGNFAEDIKNLSSIVKLDSTIAQPLALLQLFSKSMDQLDSKMLQAQVQNSGLFFESKLANIITQKGVSESIQMLSADIQEHVTHPTLSEKSVISPLVKEITTLLDRLQTTQELSSKESQTTLKTLLDLFRQNVKQEVQSQGAPLFKEVYQNVQKLDYAVQQMDLMHSKVQNYPPSMNVEEHFSTQVKVILELLKANLTTLQLDDLAPQMDELLRQPTLLKGPLVATEKVELPQTLTKDAPLDQPEAALMKEKVPLEAVLLEEAAATRTASLGTSKPPESVEEALHMVANRIKQQIQILDTKTVQQADFLEKSGVLEQKIHSLIKPELFVGKTMAQKLSLDPTDVELLSDMKGVLTKLNDNLQASGHNKEALEITNRLLTQIEYHQLVSYVSSSTHLYIPFSWDGLRGGSMMMKQSSDEKFHCQIDLDLEAYGRLNMMLVLSGEKYIDITIAAQKKELDDQITQHLSLLKQALNEVGLITGSVKMLEYKDVSAAKNDYFSGEKLQFGINIKI